MTAERVTLVPSGERVTPRLLTWWGDSPRSIESVRLRVDDRLRARARLAVAGPRPYNAAFELVVDESGALSRLLISVTTLDEDAQLSLQRSEDGYWYADDGSGAVRAAFDGAMDVDLAGSALFPTLPVRRHGLHQHVGGVELPVVRVDLPDLRPRVVRRRYQTLETTPTGAVIRCSDEGREVDLTVDTQGVVVNHPGLAVLV